MIDQVANLISQLVVVAIFSSNDRFSGLFAYLFENFIDPFFKQIGRICALRTLLITICNQTLQFIKHSKTAAKRGQVGCLGLA
ncbi:hypothetical protein D3C74_445330 [compost metagenome]